MLVRTGWILARHRLADPAATAVCVCSPWLAAQHLPGREVRHHAQVAQVCTPPPLSLLITDCNVASLNCCIYMLNIRSRNSDFLILSVIKMSRRYDRRHVSHCLKRHINGCGAAGGWGRSHSLRSSFTASCTKACGSRDLGRSGSTRWPSST